MGKKKQPIYKLVAADSRYPRDGRIIEAIGLYNPKTNPATVEIKEDRAIYWLGVGAIPTETVRSLLRKKGILLRLELKKQGFNEEEIDKKIEEWKNIYHISKQEVKNVKKIEKVEKITETPVQLAEEAETNNVKEDINTETE